MTGRFSDVVVPRWGAGRYLTVMAVCFGLTVVLTRLYLISTGYPKIGGGVYHIAHALFGGLSLVIACVLVLLYANRGVVTACAVLSGLGLGLFIDEIGKFITANNDYFFPLAAPLIYFAFLLMVLVAHRARRDQARGPRAVLLEALDGLPLLVSGRMPPSQRAVLLAQLAEVRDGDSAGDLHDLADMLEQYVRAHPSPATEGVGGKTRSASGGVLVRLEDRLAPRWVLRPLLVAVVAAHALWSVTRLALTAAVLGGWRTQFGPLATLVDTTSVHGWKGIVAWGCATAVEALSAILYTGSTVTWLRGQERRGLRSAIAATVLTLTMVNVLNSYFHQFATVFTAVAEGALLLGLLRYRTRFLPDPAPTTTPGPARVATSNTPTA